MTKKLLLALCVLLLIFAIALWRTPARLVANQLAETSQGNARLLAPKGTLWKGSGQLLVQSIPIGILDWQLQLLPLLGLALDIDWQLAGEEFTASGSFASDGQIHHLTGVEGTFNERLLQQYLATYDIAPSGTLTATQLNITDLELNAAQTWPQRVAATGLLVWSGGDVRYILAGRSHDIELPPLRANITTDNSAPDPGWPTMKVTRTDDAAPLLTGRLTPRGSAAIGITRGFTRLAGQPWPGSEPDHAVVLEVEEQLN